MGSRADDLADRVEQQRQAIGEKLDRLSHRIEDDASSAGETLKADTKRILPEDFDLRQQARERPFTLVLSALGVGTVLGMASESMPSRGQVGRGIERGREHLGEIGPDGRDGGGALGAAMGTVLGAATAPLATAMQDVVEDLTRQVTGGLINGERRSEPQNGARGTESPRAERAEP